MQFIDKDSAPKKLFHRFPNNTQSFFLLLLAVIFKSTAHPTATWSTCSFRNLRQFVSD